MMISCSLWQKYAFSFYLRRLPINSLLIAPTETRLKAKQNENKAKSCKKCIIINMNCDVNLHLMTSFDRLNQLKAVNKR